jgi:LPS-assembly protein
LFGILLASIGIAQTRPDSAPEAPPAVPPQSLTSGDWHLHHVTLNVQGHVYKLRGTPGQPAEIENSLYLFRADEIDFDQDSGDVRASGHVFFHDFAKNERLWADHLTYNTDDETGKFYDVIGETHPKVVSKPNMLTTGNPFHFEGEWAERQGEKYILHNGFITNCKIPHPWWRLRGKTFDIIPHKQAIGHRSFFYIRSIPIFYTPFFYHSLEKEPRHSGLLIPMFGHGGAGHGFYAHLGYFWAINRSYDLTYRGQFFTSALEHRTEFRGKPHAGSDFDISVFGVNDFAKPAATALPPTTYSGFSVLFVGKSELGGGWTARGSIDYISSLHFHQHWSDSYNESVATEFHSTGFIDNNWSTFTFNAIFADIRNYGPGGDVDTNPDIHATPHFVADAVTIRKLPEGELTSRERRIWDKLPIYFSFESSTGLLSRSQPIFDSVTSPTTVIDHYQTGQFMNRDSLAPHVTTAFQIAGIHFIPSFGMEETFYSQAQSPYEGRYRVIGTDIVRSTRDFSLDVIFPSLARVFDKKTIFGDKLKHVIEPRATYRYVTGVGSDFDRFIRFDENELLTNTSELLLSLTNRVYAKRGDSVEEIFTWELFQKRYFDPAFGGALTDGQRNVIMPAADVSGYAFLVGPRTASPIVSAMRISPFGGLGIRWQADYDDRHGGLVDNGIGVDYRKKYYFASASFNRVHANPILGPPASQVYFRGGFGDANHRGFNAGFQALYDLQAHQLQWPTAQVTYNTDCCGLSVQYRHPTIGAGIANQNQSPEWRVAFSVANIATPLGNLKKQDRMF